MASTARERAAQPHDALVKWTFHQREHVMALVKAALPAEWAASIDWKSFRVEKASFVDEALRDRHSDIVVSVKRAGEDVYHYCDKLRLSCFAPAASRRAVVLAFTYPGDEPRTPRRYSHRQPYCATNVSQ